MARPRDLHGSGLHRHEGGINDGLMDPPTRKVGVGKLRTLKGYRNCNTAGLWTQRGGVPPVDRPPWMHACKDYQHPLAASIYMDRLSAPLLGDGDFDLLRLVSQLNALVALMLLGEVVLYPMRRFRIGLGLSPAVIRPPWATPHWARAMSISG